MTQSAALAVCVTLGGGNEGARYLSGGALPEIADDVTLRSKSAPHDRVCVYNGGQSDADLSGWYIYSERGREIFVFPEGTVLPPGREVRVTSLSSDETGDFTWPEEKVWHKSKDDAACLYDAYGRLICRLE